MHTLFKQNNGSCIAHIFVIHVCAIRRLVLKDFYSWQEINSGDKRDKKWTDICISFQLICVLFPNDYKYTKMVYRIKVRCFLSKIYIFLLKCIVGKMSIPASITFVTTWTDTVTYVTADLVVPKFSFKTP